MEYCPEIAVLQSAFQLVSKKAGKALSDLPKERCHDYVKIVSSTVNEICTGLAHDLDLEEKSQWQEKLHLLHFYALVEKKYKEKEKPQEGTVPVCSVLDMMSVLLPTFSASFYFELMIAHGWTEKFLQSLQCLEYKTASTLFEDLLLHCHSNPVTLEDNKVIAIVTEKLLARCLCVPDSPSESCVKLLDSLNQSRQYVHTVCPENVELHSEKSGTQEKGKKWKSLIPFCANGNNTSKAGVSFFDSFVDNNPQIVDTVMSHYESVLESIKSCQKDKLHQDLLEIMATLGIWNYLVKLDTNSDKCDRWFINNVQVQDVGVTTNSVEKVDLVFSLNFTLLQSVSSCFPQERLSLCLQKALGLMLEHFEAINNPEKEEVSNLIENVQIVEGLSVTLAVLLRMIRGTYSKTGSTGSMDPKSGDTEKVEAEVADVVKNIGKVVTEVNKMEEGYSWSLTWSDDVTLEALLRRIDLKLPQYQVCMDRLLEDRNRKFWEMDRLYTVMSRHSSLLSRVDRVLCLMDILKSFKGDNSDQNTQRLLDLICAAFSELSFPDQDMVVMETYCSERCSVAAFFRDGLDRKVTNVFNKITADFDNQVLSEITLLSLGDPVVVLRTAVSLCVRNEQQAFNCAMIAQHLSRTCQSRHRVHHRDISLAALVVQDFLTSQSLSEREQKYFCIFVSELMKPATNLTKKGSVLSPVEFLHTSVLSHVSVDNLQATNVVSCHFAAALLLTAFEAGCNRSCDWSEYDFEPMVLVLSLCEIKHECVLWDARDNLVEEEKENGNNVTVAMETTSSKLILKETVTQCIEKLCQMFKEGYFNLQKSDVRWLLEASTDLHWTVKFGICSMLSACNIHEYTNHWLSTLDGLLGDLNANLVPVLQFVAMDRTLVPRILDNIPMDTQIESNELIVALIQLLPQCLIGEFESIVRFLDGLHTTESVHVSSVYRLSSTFNLPLLDFTELRPALYTSQLLGDTIIALATTFTSEAEWKSMLPHVLQCYISVMKERCNRVVDRKDLHFIYLGELFHHVCEVALNLTTGVMDSALVCLLHVLGKFKDVAIAAGRGQKKVKVDKSVIKMVKDIENGMISAIQRLPEGCEEKHMMLKKLCYQP